MNRKPRKLRATEVLSTDRLFNIATAELPDADLPDAETIREVHGIGGIALTKRQAAMVMLLLAHISRVYALALPEADRERVGQELAKMVVDAQVEQFAGLTPSERVAAYQRISGDADPTSTTMSMLRQAVAQTATGPAS